MKRPPFHIAVSGLIGAGKSTLVNGLAPLLGAEALPERFERNPYLARFYRDPARWAFQSSVFFLEQSFSDEAAVRQRRASALQERVLEEHVGVFVEAFHDSDYLQGLDLQLLSRLADTAGSLMPASDLLLHVDISPEEALRRVRIRDRPEEHSIDLPYLQQLSARYARFVEGWRESPVLVVSANEHDFREDEHLRVLAAMVEDALSVTTSR